MAMKLPLLDKIADDLNLLYLSELNAIISAGTRKVSDIYNSVSLIQPNTYDVNEWNEALAYLFHLPPQKTAEDAKAAMLDALNNIR